MFRLRHSSCCFSRNGIRRLKWLTRDRGMCCSRSSKFGILCGQTGRNFRATRIPSHFSIGLVGGMNRRTPPSTEAYWSPKYASTAGRLRLGSVMSTPLILPYWVSITRGLICVANTFDVTCNALCRRITMVMR